MSIGLENLPVAFHASSRVLKHIKRLGMWKRKDGRHRRVVDQEFDQQNRSSEDRQLTKTPSPTAGAMLGGDVKEESVKVKDMETDVQPFWAKVGYND